MKLARGFTLIEILIVVAIIVVLAAMLFPVYEAATKRAESTGCLMNVRNIAIAVGLYADDWDGRCVPARIGGPGPAASLGICWDTLLQPYLRSTGILLCPSDLNPTATSGSVSVKHSYGINYDISLIGGYNGASLPMASIEQPSLTIMFFDLVGGTQTMGASFESNGLARVGARHAQGANFSFVAGNAKWYRPDRTAQPKDSTTVTNLWQP